MAAFTAALAPADAPASIPAKAPAFAPALAPLLCAHFAPNDNPALAPARAAILNKMAWYVAFFSENKWNKRYYSEITEPCTIRMILLTVLTLSHYP